MTEPRIHGLPSWVDLATPDPAVSAAFYGELFGWTIEAQVTAIGEYYVARAGRHEVGGMMEPATEGAPPVWTTFFTVADVDEAAVRAADLGGRVLQPPFAIPGDAPVAVIADPTGAMLALISSPETPAATWLTKLPGAVCWVELLTCDTSAAEGFYAAFFGWKSETELTGGHAYTMFRRNGFGFAGMMAMPDEVPAEAPAHWAVYFAVADCRSTAEAATRLGGSVLHPATEIDIGRFAVLADPHGATFHIMEFSG